MMAWVGEWLVRRKRKYRHCSSANGPPDIINDHKKDRTQIVGTKANIRGRLPTKRDVIVHVQLALSPSLLFRECVD